MNLKTIKILLFCSLHFICFAQTTTPSFRTKVILLGTGTPNPDPEHSGCSIAILVDDVPYIIDFGPGLIRKAASLSPRYGGNFERMNVKEIKRAFLTHLHSDHTVGYADLILTPWVMGRNEPLEVYGPEGIVEMTNHILKAYEQDINYRIYGSEPANNIGWRVNAHEFSEGVIYKDDLVKVEAFPVKHGTLPNAYGFRFSTVDRVIVISGDTMPCENILKYAKGADILLHEVYSKAGFDTKPDVWKEYHSTHHTSTIELGELAKETKPDLVILYHILFWGASAQNLLEEISQVYNGPVVVGKDLEIY